MITSLLLAIQINLAIIFHKTIEKLTALFVFLNTCQEARTIKGNLNIKNVIIHISA